MEYEKALARLMRQCSLCEKCRKDAYTLLKRWEVEPDKQKEIVDYLVENRYIDDRRYAEAYVKDKSRFSNWGEAKIKMGLREKGISSEVIDELMELVDSDMMKEKIERALTTKMQGLKYKDKYDLRNKLLRFAFSRGYNMDIVIKFVDNFK